MLLTLTPLLAARPHGCATEADGGFLSDIFDNTPGLKQQVSALASNDFQSNLTWAEVTLTAPSAGDQECQPDSDVVRHKLRDEAIAMCGGADLRNVIFVKFRSNNDATPAVNRSTTYNIGFDPPELHTAFMNRARHLESNALGGFRIRGCPATVFDAPSVKGYRFYVPLPRGWTDEEMMRALVEQGGLDPDHLLSFGVDVPRGLAVSAPSGDMFFNYAPAGCIGHGSTVIMPITQPPNRLFVTHPVSGIENHVKIRKAAACGHCWASIALVGRHNKTCIFNGVCMMCNEVYAELENGGKRHACGQGYMSKPQVRQAVNPGETPLFAPPPSPMAVRIRAEMARNIELAKSKRKREAEAAAAPAQEAHDPPPAPAAGSESPNKACRSGNDSPGGAAPEDPTPAEQARATPARTVVKPRSARGKNP